MATYRTYDEFSSATTADFTWRLREISDFRLILKTMDKAVEQTVLRAGIPLLYAHWEGHVRFVAKAYMQFLCRRRLLYRQLRPNFRINEFYISIQKMRGGNLSLVEQIEFLERVLSIEDSRMGRFQEEVISSRSNLNSEVLFEICSALGISRDPFRDELSFIDKILIARRNAIAHGEFLGVTTDDFIQMSDRLIGMMRTFRNLVDNDVALRKYYINPAA